MKTAINPIYSWKIMSETVTWVSCADHGTTYEWKWSCGLMIRWNDERPQTQWEYEGELYTYSLHYQMIVMWSNIKHTVYLPRISSHKFTWKCVELCLRNSLNENHTSTISHLRTFWSETVRHDERKMWKHCLYSQITESFCSLLHISQFSQSPYAYPHPPSLWDAFFFSS